ncbi:urate hydroxylase PuuD [Sessilibacter sp. MAH4]
MSAYLLDWLSLAFRWLHILAAVAWIGSSLKYVWIDNNLRKPPQWKADKGIKGDVWVIHGGGIYEFQKYDLAPEKMPDVLHWVKWESYTTWLSGFLLISIVYYSQASSYLVTPDGLITDPTQAVLAGIGFLATTVVVYELLIRTPLVTKGLLFAAIMSLFFLGLSYLAFQLFSPRAAALHVGAAIGTLMSGNVFFGIVPAQKAFIKAIESGQEPDAKKAAFAKQRSMHNNYFTLAVVLLMISNHYPILYSHEYGWFLIVAVGVLSAYIRHFFNLKNRGVLRPQILIISAAFIVALIYFAKPNIGHSVAAANHSSAITEDMRLEQEAVALDIVSQHCSGCHSLEPTQPGFVAPPAGLVLDSKNHIVASKDRILAVSVQSQYMPLGNLTGMTQAEREQLGEWLVGLE